LSPVFEDIFKYPIIFLYLFLMSNILSSKTLQSLTSIVSDLFPNIKIGILSFSFNLFIHSSTPERVHGEENWC